MAVVGPGGGPVAETNHRRRARRGPGDRNLPGPAPRSRARRTLTALDFSAQSAAICARIPGGSGVRGDAQHLPFADAAFDAATIVVLHRDDALLFPGPEPVVAYLGSVLTLQGVPEDADLRRSITVGLEAAARARFRTLPGGIWREPKGYTGVTAAVLPR